MALTKMTPRASAEKPFSCEQCSYCTDRKANLVRHAKKHEKKEEWLELDPGNLSDVMGDTAKGSSSESFPMSDSENTDAETEKGHDKTEQPLPSTSSDGLEVGRVVRKQTHPAPPAAPKRKMPPPRPSPPCSPLAGNREGKALAYARSSEHCIPQKVPRVAHTPLPRRIVTTSTPTSNCAGTQTEIVRRRKVTWTCKKYKDGKKNVEEIEWEEEEFYY